MNDQVDILSNQNKNDVKSYLFNNKKKIIALIIIILTALFSYFFYSDYKKNLRAQISDQYNLAVINFNKDDTSKSLEDMKNIIILKDSTYSPLALYFLLDNNLLNDRSETNKYFDILINDSSLDKEVLNLIILKKGLYNSNYASESELLAIFNPLITSENIWKSHALYIIAEYFYSKNEMQKSKDFFEKILELKNSNPQIKFEAQKRLQRDFSV